MKKWEEPAIWMLGVESTAGEKGNGSQGGTVPPPSMPNKIAGIGDDLYISASDNGHWEDGWTSHS